MPGFHGTIHSEQYPATVAMQCVMVVIPEGEEYTRLLAALLNIAGDPESYDDPLSAQTDGLCFAWDESYFLTDWLDCGDPPGDNGLNSTALLFGSTATVKTGNALALVIDAAQRFNGYYQQNPSANGDKFEWTVWLQAGNWAYRWFYQRTTGSAQVNLKVIESAGIVENTTVDQFGATQANTIANGSFTLAEGGEVDVLMEVTGRNAGNTTAWLNRTIVLEMWRV